MSCSGALALTSFDSSLFQNGGGLVLAGGVLPPVNGTFTSSAAGRNTWDYYTTTNPKFAARFLGSLSPGPLNGPGDFFDFSRKVGCFFFFSIFFSQVGALRVMMWKTATLWCDLISMVHYKTPISLSPPPFDPKHDRGPFRSYLLLHSSLHSAQPILPAAATPPCCCWFRLR